MKPAEENEDDGRCEVGALEGLWEEESLDKKLAAEVDGETASPKSNFRKHWKIPKKTNYVTTPCPTPGWMLNSSLLPKKPPK